MYVYHMWIAKTLQGTININDTRKADALSRLTVEAEDYTNRTDYFSTTELVVPTICDLIPPLLKVSERRVYLSQCLQQTVPSLRTSWRPLLLSKKAPSCFSPKPRGVSSAGLLLSGDHE